MYTKYVSCRLLCIGSSSERGVDVEEEKNGRERMLRSEGTDPSTELGKSGAETAMASLVRREEFPLSAFLKRGAGSEGEGGRGGRWPGGEDLPELVREELVHRFITGELLRMLKYDE